MSQLYYPVGGNEFINTTNYIDYSNNLQNIYLNVENNINRNKNSQQLIELKDTLYKELTSDCNELFQEVVKEINSKKDENLITESKQDSSKKEESSISEDSSNQDSSEKDDSVKKDLDFFINFKNTINEFKKIFLDKQDRFIKIDNKLNTETKKVEKDLKNLETMITFINNLDEDYSETEEIKRINENIILLSQKIEKNNILKSAKEDYIKIRIEINECFDIIKTLNNLNYSNTCSLCLTNKVEEFIDPCGHCLCSGCKTRYIEFDTEQNNTNCPLCRGYVKDFKPLYL